MILYIHTNSIIIKTTMLKTVIQPSILHIPYLTSLIYQLTWLIPDFWDVHADRMTPLSQVIPK
jgi:hypothetical protein